MIRADGVYTYPYVTAAAIAAVRRRNPGQRALVRRLPPIAVAFLYHVYNGGGYPIQSRGKRWVIDTMFQHIELEIIDFHSAQLRVWACTSGPEYEGPAIDRTIECSKERA